MFLVTCVLGYSSMSGTCDATQSSVSQGMGGPTSYGNGGYSIVVPSTYTPGQPFNVRISGADYFKGFLLYAEDELGTRIGSFSSPISQSNIFGCNTPATITQKNANLKGICMTHNLLTMLTIQQDQV
jgi:hypothetical protein